MPVLTSNLSGPVARRAALAALAAVVALAFVWAPAAPALQPPETRPAGPGPAVVVVLSGQVDDYARDALVRRFERARELGATTVILEIDTWGGLVTSALDISRFIKNQRDLHTVAFVNSKAISAGALIALACDEVRMTPSATLGDCAPIQVAPGGGMHTMGETERGKAESPVLADFEESAARNGYDPLLARAMVSLKHAVYWVENDAGRRRFVNEADHKAMTADGGGAEGWRLVPGVTNPVDGPDTLLTVGTDLALKLGLAKGTAASAEAVAHERGQVVAATFASGAGDQAVALLGRPLVRTILFVIFLQALFIALHTPGHGAPEAVAALSLAVLVGVPLLTGFAQWWEIALIFAGLALIAFEIFVFPGHFVSLAVGSVMVLAGLVLTFVGDAWGVPGSWRMPGTWRALEHGLYAITGGLFCSVLLSMWLRRYLPKLPYFNKLILNTASGGQFAGPLTVTDPSADDAAAAGGSGIQEAWPFVGTVGLAVSDLRPGGSAEFPYADDTRVTAVICDCGYVRAGAKLVVREVRGSRVVVRPVPTTTPTA